MFKAQLLFQEFLLFHPYIFLCPCLSFTSSYFLISSVSYFLTVLAGSVGRIGTKYMKVLNYMSDMVSHLNVIKGYTRRWGKMTSQIHRLTLHLTGYYKETQQSRHNAWQQKIENKCLQNDDEKRVFFSISMFFFFPHYGMRRTVPCTNKNNDCNQRNVLRIMHWHLRRTETYWLTTALLCARHYWLCFLHVFEENETSSAEMSLEILHLVTFGATASLLLAAIFKVLILHAKVNRRELDQPQVNSTLRPRAACFQQL